MEKRHTKSVDALVSCQVNGPNYKTIGKPDASCECDNINCDEIRNCVQLEEADRHTSDDADLSATYPVVQPNMWGTREVPHCAIC